MNINEPAMISLKAVSLKRMNLHWIIVKKVSNRKTVKMFRCKTENRSDRKEEANPKNAHLFKRFECSGLMVFRELWMQEKMRLF